MNTIAPVLADIASRLDRLLEWFRQRRCRHEFAIEDLHKTGIPELEKPTSKDYGDWLRYYAEIDKHDSYTKRVYWPCAKCEKMFYAHCGLDISPRHGPMIRRGDV